MSCIKIKSIYVEGFRGVLKAELPINGMTILAGKNSTGKSSLIQSLLILAQSREERVRTNGSILMLGDAKGNINDNSPQESLFYRFEFNITDAEVLNGIKDKSEIDYDESFIFEIRFKPSANELAGLSLEEMVLKQGNYEIMHCLNRSVNSSAKSDLESFDNAINASLLDSLRLVSIMGKKSKTTTIFFNGITPKYCHFKLREEVVRKNIKKILRDGKVEKGSLGRRRASALAEIAEFAAFRTERKEDFDRFGPLMNKLMNKIYIQEFDKEMLTYSSSETIKKIVEYAEIPNDKSREKNNKAAIIAATLFKEIQEKEEYEIIRYVDASLYRFPYLFMEEEILAEEDLIFASRLIGIVTEGIGAFLADIRYLGPLRAEPKAAYGSAYTTPNTPLGINGGSTAEYLHRSFIKSSSIVDDKKVDDKKGVSLDAEAKAKLDHMVDIIGVGKHVEVEQVGRFGYTIKIEQHGTDRDLTEMGTGVSQVIPVLALLLSAPNGSLVILEQPELHLHAEIQSGLAQLLHEESKRINIICETHSEYVVTRLRRIALESSLERLKIGKKNTGEGYGDRDSNIEFVWSEPNYGNENGEVIGYSLSRIDQDNYHDILEWPVGFFDQQAKDVEAILKAKLALLEIESK